MNRDQMKCVYVELDIEQYSTLTKYATKAERLV